MKIEKLKILSVAISDKNKDGAPFLTKAGKPFKKIAIKVEDYPAYLSDFLWRDDDFRFQWKVGDVVEVIVSQNGQWWNFKCPSEQDKLLLRVEDLETRVKNLEAAFKPSNADELADEDTPPEAPEEELPW